MRVTSRAQSPPHMPTSAARKAIWPAGAGRPARGGPAESRRDLRPAHRRGARRRHRHRLRRRRPCVLVAEILRRLAACDCALGVSRADAKMESQTEHHCQADNIAACSEVGKTDVRLRIAKAASSSLSVSSSIHCYLPGSRASCPAVFRRVQNLAHFRKGFSADGHADGLQDANRPAGSLTS